jgi:FHS family Na+ dependent glucose MFS transporter 1
VSLPLTQPLPKEERSRNSVLAQTAAYYVAFVALGLTGPLFGPALSSLAAQTGVALNAISAIFVANSLGRLAGSLLAGRLLDRLPGHRVIVVGFGCAAVLMALTPFVPALTLLVVAFFILGIAQNLIDVGGNTLLVWAHGGARVGPFMNGLHLMFGIGAFLAPLLVARSLAIAGDASLAFWVVAAGMIPIMIWLLRVPSPLRQSTAAATSSAAATGGPAIALVCIFFFLIVGAEVAMSGWVFNYGTASGMARDTAAALASVFWGAYIFSRLLAIPVSIRVLPERILIVNLIGCVVSAVVLAFGHVWPLGAWLGAAGIGFFIASTFPTMLSWLGGRINVTGRINGFLFASSNLGAMVFPFVIGQMFEPIGPQSLAFAVLTSLTAAAIMFFIISATFKRR